MTPDEQTEAQRKTWEKLGESRTAEQMVALSPIIDWLPSVARHARPEMWHGVVDVLEIKYGVESVLDQRGEINLEALQTQCDAILAAYPALAAR